MPFVPTCCTCLCAPCALRYDMPAKVKWWRSSRDVDTVYIR